MNRLSLARAFVILPVLERGPMEKRGLSAVVGQVARRGLAMGAAKTGETTLTTNPARL